MTDILSDTSQRQLEMDRYRAAGKADGQRLEGEILSLGKQAEINRIGAARSTEVLMEHRRDAWVPILLSLGAAVAVACLQGLTVAFVVEANLVVATPSFWTWAVVTGACGALLGAVVAGSMRRLTPMLVAVDNAPAAMPVVHRALIHLGAGILVGFAAEAQGLALAVLAGG